jgi:glucosamine-6-phosphate deaminase
MNSIDQFNQHNSFIVNKFYIDGFGLDRKKALLIKADEIGLHKAESLENIWPGNIVDLSLRIKPPKNSEQENQKRVLDAVDQFCSGYEQKIRSLGGIGFFLGGIGPDGHIGFNVRVLIVFDYQLAETNYQTQAAAASLSGIKYQETAGYYNRTANLPIQRKQRLSSLQRVKPKPKS